MAASPRPDVSALPNFCGGEAVLAVLVIMQTVAVLLLVGQLGDPRVWERLLLLSLYLHWIGLCSAAVLCLARRWMSDEAMKTALLVSYGLLLGITAVITESAWQLAQWLNLQYVLPDREHGVFLLRSLLICAVVSALTLRYFWLQAQWRGQVRAEGQSRYQALQARIRPHFLFNSLNSIAALIGSRPREAETAVEDLAQLFRAGLSASERRIPLREELDVTRAYLRTEMLRLGERLRVRWAIDDGVEERLVPPLSLQPLVENAVTHGIEPLPQGGEIAICIEKSDRHLWISVENPTPAQPQESLGARSALDNIRQRLALIYGADAELELEVTPERFVSRLKLPLTDAPA